jgi:hypothetical protein
MKTTFIIIYCILLSVAIAFGDEVDDRLPKTVPQELKARTRNMIHTGINSDDAIEITGAMLQHQFEIRHILDAQKIIVDTHKKGLPTAPVMNKAYEGMSKQVTAGNIVQAMQKVQSRYNFAYDQADEITKQHQQKNQLGNILAAGLAAGINQVDATKIMNTLKSRAQNMNPAQLNTLAVESLKTVRDMARLGVSSKASADVVGQALQKGYSSDDMKSMRSSFISQSQHTSPQNLVKNYSKAIQSGKSFQGTGTHGGSHSGSPGDAGGNGDSGGTGGSGGPGGAGGPGGHGGHGGHG